MRKNYSKERTTRTSAVVERAQVLISDDPGQSLRKLASIIGVNEPTMRRIAEEDLRIVQIVYVKDTTDALWGCQDKLSCLPFWPNNPDLNPLDYYVSSVVETVTNKSRHLNVTSLRTAIKAAFVGMELHYSVRANISDQELEAVIQTNRGYIE